MIYDKIKTERQRLMDRLTYLKERLKSNIKSING